jgi:hypothetical protein
MRYAAILFLCVLGFPASADEGMWLFDRFPKAAVKQKYGMEVSDGFLDNLRLASARIGGGTGAFVSSTGLLLTNQHLVSNCLAKLSSPAHDYLRDGFYAASQAQEARCPDLQASVLTGIEDVTQQVGSPAQRNASISRIESECAAKSGELCQVVNLYYGSRYDLYRYKRYGDLRLVFAPEQQLAFFGRERDSITYLRYGLDIAFLRAYENEKPAATPHYLKWSTAGVKEGDLVFASGNPQVTMRETTGAQLTFYRDTALPVELARLAGRIRALNQFAAKSDENRKLAQPALTAYLEGYKSAAGKLIGLRDDRLVVRKTIFDQKIRRAVEANAKLGAEAGKVWDRVATAYKNWAPYEKPYQILIGQPAALDFSTLAQPVKVVLVTEYLSELKNLSEHGEKEIPLKAILAGRTPEAAADELVKSSDGMARLAQLLEGPAQRLKKKHEEVIGTVEASAATQIAQYRYKLFGDAEYPDATGTPRVEFGVLKSYTDRAGVNEPYAATFSGLFYRRNNQPAYQAPQRWLEARPALNLTMPLDFVSTCDIGGGDAGAPTVNRAGELIGLIFDGNLESLPNTYLYTDDQARAVHVAAEGIAEALEKVYHAEALLRELGLPAGGGAL